METAKKLLMSEFNLSEKQVNLSRIENGDVLLPFVSRLVKIKNDTGLKLPLITASDVIDGDECCIAGYKAGEKALYISSKFFNSKEALTDTLKEWANNNIMPKQAKTIEYLAEHEAAHIRISNGILNSDEAYKLWKSGKKKLSNKNDTDIFEYFADVVAISRTNSKVTDRAIIQSVEYLKSKGVSV